MQFQKAEYKRMERAWKSGLLPYSKRFPIMRPWHTGIESERKQRSAALQQKLFEQFKMLNYRGEVKDALRHLRQTVHKKPACREPVSAPHPNCCNKAYLHGWKPLQWQNSGGRIPKTEIRHHGHYYPACKASANLYWDICCKVLK